MFIGLNVFNLICNVINVILIFLFLILVNNLLVKCNFVVGVVVELFFLV